VAALEEYFARSLGFALLALALIAIALSGVIPLGSSYEGKLSLNPPAAYPCQSDSPSNCLAESKDHGVSPYANAVLVISTAYHATVGFYCYGWYTWSGETGYGLGCLGSSLFASFALYCVMFAGDKAMVSRNHKFDQSTSGFPFSNSQSYKAKKKAL
jgi:hypothetical protein